MKSMQSDRNRYVKCSARIWDASFLFHVNSMFAQHRYGALAFTSKPLRCVHVMVFKPSIDSYKKKKGHILYKKGPWLNLWPVPGQDQQGCIITTALCMHIVEPFTKVGFSCKMSLCHWLTYESEHRSSAPEWHRYQKHRGGLQFWRK